MIAFLTLFHKELMRFWKVSFQTVLAPMVSTLLYLLIFLHVLDAHREEIATVWAHAIREQMPDTTYGQRPVKEISAYNQVGLDIVKELLLGTGLFPPEWSRPGQTLAQAGVQIEEASKAAWLFQDIIHPFVSRSFSLKHAELQDALTKIDGCVREFVMHVLKNYALEKRREVERQQQRTELVLETTRQVSRTLEMEDVLRRVAVGIATSVDAHHCIIYILDEEGNKGTLCGARLGCANVHHAVDLARVGRNNLAIEPVGQLKRKGCLAHCCRANDGNQLFVVWWVVNGTYHIDKSTFLEMRVLHLVVMLR